LNRLGYAAKDPAAAAGAQPAPLEPQAPILPRRSPGEVPRCSFAQEQFWFVDQVTPGNLAYNFSWPLRLRGPLDSSALARALGEVVRRHEALRTGFSMEDGDPVQMIGSHQAFTLAKVDVGAEAAPEEAAQRLVDLETQRPFDLRRPGLFRAQLIRLADDDHILQIVVHHIVFDEWSKVVVYRELGDLYAAFAEGRPSPLPEPRAQYADFAEWQRSRLTDDVLGEELAHWTSELTGASTALDLPSDRPRPPVASMRGGRLRLPLPAELTEQLEQLATREGTDFFAAVLALFELLLFRYTGEEDFLIGAVADDRTDPGLDDTVGVLLNTVVLRSDLSGGPDFRTLLQRVRDRVLAAAAHAELPFERLVRELQPVRDLSRHPLFQVLLAINPPDPVIELPGVDVVPAETHATAAGVDVFLFLQETSEGYDAVWEYNGDLFHPETIERMHAHLVCLLGAVIDSPAEPIAELPMLADEERQRLLTVSNGPEIDYPPVPLHELVEARARANPDATAIVGEGEQLTYGELNARANQLARHLQSLGVVRDSVVAISLERSPDLVVGALGILKAGGAYMPLDPGLPEERLGFTLADSQADVLVTHDSLAERLHAFEGRIVRLDADWEAIAHADASDPRIAVEPDDAAYVIYTSGSTGQPKGVLNTHRGIVNRLLSMQDTYPIGPSDRLLQKTQIGFDVSVRELFWPLIHGARIVIATPGEHGNPAYLAEVIEREQITTLHFVPSMLQLFLEEADPARCASLHCILSGGEPLPLDLVRRFFDRFTCELHNLYGPSEAAVSVTSWRCEPGYEGAIAPIGQPVANTQVYVLDSRLEPAPVGVWGELYIGGAQVARGYLDRPELTAERFVDNPFGPGRIYMTGDQCRWTAQGVVEFRGRLDDQVKVRGFRVEPGEIEAILREDEAVAECAVVAVESAGGHELAAYVVVKDGSAADSSGQPDLSGFLAAKLPDYMVPSSFTVLNDLPRLPNGKLDRAALPDPERSTAREEYVAPGTESEREIARLFADVLGVERVGRNDNFFTLGGHSLLAARLVARACRQFDVEVPLRAFLQKPTVAGLASELDGERHEPEMELPPLVSRSNVRETSFAQERFWFIDQVMGSSAAYNIPAGVRLRGDLEVPLLERALTEIVQRHDILRTHLSVEDGRPIQVTEPLGQISLDIVDLSGLEHDEREEAAQRLVDEDTQAAFDVTRGPLFQARLIRLDPRDHILQIVFHHVVFDGFSKLLFHRELGTLYSAFVRGESSPLPALGVQYCDFADWQRSWLRGDLLERELRHWTESLEGMPDALELPTDRTRPAVSSMRGAWLRTSIPPRIAEGLKALARDEGATFYMALLAVFDILLQRYSGQDDIVLGMPVDNRDRPDLDDVIGVFVDTVVLRVDLSGNVTFRELLDRVRGRMVDAMAHQRLPFEQLVRALDPDRQLGRHPLYQVMLTLVPCASPPELEGLEVEETITQRATSPIDLTVFLEQRDSGLDAIWEYSTDLFDEDTITGMQSRYQQLLEAAIAEPDRPINELEMLAADERTQVLESWAGSDVEFPIACLHERFEANAAATPDAQAVVCEGVALTYGELNERANQLAHRLRELGVGPEVPVALCLRRSVDLVVAVLATLKAGGAYLPLDPDYPTERLAFVLSDARPPVLLTQEELLSELPEHGATVVCLDRDASTLAGHDSQNPEPSARPHNLAYIIYTSGSTGQPKGVQIEHRNVARLFTATDEWFGFGPDDTWLLFHSYAFDFSVWEMWGALLNGGRLVVAPYWTTRSPEALAELVVDERITVLNATPTLFVSSQEELVRVGSELALRFVIFGGEALHPPSLRPWFARFGDDGPTLVNMYGITETTVHVTYRVVGPEDCDSESSPIGQPIPDLQLYVLDGQLNPVAPGVPGELFVGGAGVARGYLDRPTLTAERFLPNPFGPGRLYRSGDKARYRADGELHFLGRIDDQVKIRGFRIELGEIQAALTEHDAVSEATVIAVEVSPGDTRLAAYIVPAATSAGAVRRILRLENEGRLDAAQLVELSGDLTVACADKDEAERLYEMIYTGRAYLGEAVELPEDACVIDVGAGIGLFDVLVGQLSPRARVVAVESDADRRDALTLNAEIHGVRVHVLDQVSTISDLLHEHGLGRVDLLKVSDGKRGLELVAGMDEPTWSCVRQVVVDPGGDREIARAATELLEARGFTIERGGPANEPSDRTVIGLRSRPTGVTVRHRRPSLSVERLRRELREHLELRLPAFMVPSSLTLLPELPRTSNGKLDRKALPAPVWEEQTGGETDTPLTGAEIRIAEIWKGVLGTDTIGAGDNFFHLGGHSLLAARAVTQVREAFSVELSVRSLFEHPTLSGFAEHVSAAVDAASHAGDESASQEAHGQSLYPPSLTQQPLLFIDELATDVATYNGTLAFRIVGDLDRDALESAVADVIARHEALHTVFEWQQDGPVQVVLDRWEFALPAVDLSSLPEGEREGELGLRLREESRRPFDLSQDLMTRVTLFELSPREHVLLVVTHHIASDGWSVGVFCRDVSECYRARRTQTQPSLPELPLQYRDFSSWQRGRLSGAHLENELGYWRSRLAGAPTVVELPTARPRPARQTFEGASLPVELPSELGEGTLRLARDLNATPYMLLLALFAVLLYRRTGQDDILIGSPYANRRRSEFDDLVGFIANTLVMRVRLGGNPSFAAVVEQVRNTVLEAIDHQEVPFEQVVDAVRPPRDPRVNPLVQVNFRARTEAPAAPELEGAETSRVAFDAGFAAFELALDLHVLEEGIVGEFLYNTALFDDASIVRLADDFNALLEQILASSDTRLLALQVPSENQPVVDGNATKSGPSIRRYRESSSSRGSG
jgi:amino acid adenylation domain-containing protein